jgi:hypothetical protein
MSTEINPQLVLALYLDLESKILRALCNEPPPPISPGTHDATPPAAPHQHDPALIGKRAAIFAQLRAYPWQDPEHRVIFEALTALPGRSATELREQLPAQATRMGFPDVNWQNYFAPAAADSALETLVAELLNCAKRNSP